MKNGIKKLLIIPVFALLLFVSACAGSIVTTYGLDSFDFDSSLVDNIEEMVVYTTNLVMESSVEVTVEFEITYTQYNNRGQPMVRNERIVGQGSAFFINDEGYLITNSHVINLEEYEDFPDFTYLTRNISVNYALSTITFAATIVSYDETLDLAIIKIDASAIDNINYLTFFNLTEPSSDLYETQDAVRLVYGETVLAIGNANGYGLSVTKGVVSAPLRYFNDNGTMTQAIQTDAAINEGNSGGALVNLYGAVIGVNTFKVVTETSESLGFAIPANVVITFINSQSENITYYTTDTRAYL